MFISNQFNLLPKSISTLLILVFIANLALFAMIFHPKPVYATVPTSEIASVPSVMTLIWNVAKAVWEKDATVKDALYQLWDRFQSSHGVIAEALSITFTIAMHQLLAKMTNDIIAWINGGYRGKPRIMQDFGKELQDSLDEAGGVVMGAITGLDPKTLCDPSWKS